jgi:hypothetical protein
LDFRALLRTVKSEKIEKAEIGGKASDTDVSLRCGV